MRSPINPRAKARASNGRRSSMPSPTPIGDHRQLELLGQRHQHAALGAAVELGHHQRIDRRHGLEGLDLGMGVLAGRGVEHQQAGMRRRRIELADDAHDLGELVHQVGLVVQAARRVDQQHVAAFGLGALQRLVGETRGIGAGVLGDHRHAGAIAPHFQLLDGGGAEGIARRQHDLAALALVEVGELGDGRGLAAAVDADHQHDMRLAAPDRWQATSPPAAGSRRCRRRRRRAPPRRSLPCRSAPCRASRPGARRR